MSDEGDERIPDYKYEAIAKKIDQVALIAWETQRRADSAKSYAMAACIFSGLLLLAKACS